MRVRRMEAGEGPRLRDLRREALTLEPEAFGATLGALDARPARWFAMLAAGPGAVFVLGDWDGMLGVRIEGDEPWLWGTWVSPGRRGAGAGRALLDAAIRWARARGLEAMRLKVMEQQPAARGLYESAGFVPTGRRGPEIVMVLALHPPPRRIETERLLLRMWQPTELAELHALRSYEGAVRWLYEDPATEDESRARLARRVGETRFAITGDAIGLAIDRDGVVVGDVSLHFTSAEHLQAEIGYIVHPDHQGRGYATEAAAALVDHAFDELGLHRVIGTVEPRNAGSTRVLELVGMTREALLVENELVKGEWQSEAIYAVRASRGGGSSRSSRPAAAP
jgi:RimJ/RimL family protein N-acetyltransferase